MTPEIPLIITGPQRSGTTIFGQMLSSHSDIGLTVDGKLLYYLIVWLIQDQAAHRNCHPRLDEISFALRRSKIVGLDRSYIEKMALILERETLVPACCRAGYLKQVGSLWKRCYKEVFGAKKIIGDKYNEYMLYAQDIFDVFPDAKMIVMKRDPSDCALSSMRHFQGRSWQPRDFGIACRKVEGWQRALDIPINAPSQVLTLEFTDLMRDHRACLSRACRFLGVPECDRMYAEAQRLFQPEKVIGFNRKASMTACSS